MKVIEFIRQYGDTPADHDLAFKKLTDTLGISVKFVDDLIVLNYNQIESPKTDPIVMECRSLILEAKTLKVVSRSFDRFFNYGEALNVMPEIDWSRARAYEKVDGSLIKIYNHNDHWYISTKGTAYGESDCMGYGITFAELVYKALGCEDDYDFQERCFNADLWPEFTYIFEVTSVENRVVRRYEGYALHALAVRSNHSGNYMSNTEIGTAVDFGASEPECFSFESAEDCIRAASKLKNLDEGYVIYQDGVPVAKIKSQAYVAVHHIRGEGLNPKRIMQLVLTNEQDEYLQYFPEDRAVMQPYILGKINIDEDIAFAYNIAKDIVDQKEFAMFVGKYSYKSALFRARQKGIEAIQAFNDQRDSYKMEILKGYVK